MKKAFVFSSIVSLFISSFSLADTFGAGDNQFEIDFVDIYANPGVTHSTNTSGDTVITSTNGTLGDYTDPGYDYRMGKFEITNDQWTKFTNNLGVPVTGDPSSAYDEDSYWTGPYLPANRVSWFEAAQFVNWLNTSQGHQAAYKFIGTQGQSDYALSVWDVTETDGTNLYRHKDAYYFLPTEDEWVKVAYWNGTTLQTFATLDDTFPTPGLEANFFLDTIGKPWTVGSGRVELNGTFDMMGNVFEWNERLMSSYNAAVLGGSYANLGDALESSYRTIFNLGNESYYVGFRVASIPEPATLALLALGGLVLRRQR